MASARALWVVCGPDPWLVDFAKVLSLEPDREGLTGKALALPGGDLDSIPGTALFPGTSRRDPVCRAKSKPWASLGVAPGTKDQTNKTIVLHFFELKREFAQRNYIIVFSCCFCFCCSSIL